MTRKSILGDNRARRITACLMVSFLLFRPGGEGYAEEGTEELEITVVTSMTQPEYKYLSSGSRGESVRILQERLKELGYDPGTPDGDYGAGTAAAVTRFQKVNGLDADGIAGRDTQNLLYSADAIPNLPPADAVDVLAGDIPLLVNKEHPVTEEFVPANLILLTEVCPTDLVKIKYADTRGVREAAEALVTMLRAAHEDGLKKWQVSAGYRTWESQESLLNHKINGYLNKNSGWSRKKARSAALKTVAEPGTSEHHLGLAFDVNVPNTSSFSGTKQCKWLSEHCWEYGFIIRYEKGKESITGFSAEPWHIRYVGKEHAAAIRESGLCLEEYLAQIGTE